MRPTRTMRADREGQDSEQQGVAEVPDQVWQSAVAISPAGDQYEGAWISLFFRGCVIETAAYNIAIRQTTHWPPDLQQQISREGMPLSE